MIAVVPGLSRSGSTITGGLTQGLDREQAVKYSFIMSIPAVLGANILEIPDIIRTPVPQSDIFNYAVGMFTALIAGIAAIKLLNYISKKSNFRIFSYYCVIIGIITVIFG
jgi:undecaprenyl-diphosphatase